jgi:chitodextrinase
MRRLILSVLAVVLLIGAERALADKDPPKPSPMTWETEPYATGCTSISMTATTASDPSGVQYYFDCTSGGGHDSGWQDEPTYEDTGLSELTQYSYRVKARDRSKNLNETDWSTTKSATTEDCMAPTPSPMTWETEPYATGSTSISMTATTASDPSGVQYYFDCTSGGGHDSGWQDEPDYTDTGLSPGTQYTYRVKARDKSENLNETDWSMPASATTED